MSDGGVCRSRPRLSALSAERDRAAGCAAGGLSRCGARAGAGLAVSCNVPVSTVIHSPSVHDAPRIYAGAAGVGLGARIAVVAGRPVRRVRIRAHTRRWVAGPGDMALVARRAGDGVAAGADTGPAGVGVGEGVAVGKGGDLGGGRVVTKTSRGVAGSCDMALVTRRAGDGVAARADTGPAGVGLGAGVAVVAGRPVRRVRVGAGSSRGVAGPGDMALVARRADDRVAAGADTGLAGV